MTLRTKTLISVALLTLILLIALLFIMRLIIINSFAVIEEKNVEKRVEQFLSALESQIADISATVGDYAGWDDTYYFLKNRNDAYLQSNMVDSTFMENNLNHIILVDVSGSIVYGKSFDSQQKRQIPLVPGFKKLVEKYSKLIQHQNTNK
ncbi:CHASE4 domain-containing protein [Microaerobacter geothermalis]|uniref:CHASE4 domain-containing protein n=1 Tax=Microaerobacter geothermalis TaxID=674972 RepID=UPI0022A6F80C|nr:CHASE4 domain-containing protein [Microaerobacter geothermalis]